MLRMMAGRPRRWCDFRAQRAADDVTLPAQHGSRCDEEAQTCMVALGDDPEQQRDQRTISLRSLRSRIDLTLEHRELMS